MMKLIIIGFFSVLVLGCNSGKEISMSSNYCSKYSFESSFFNDSIQEVFNSGWLSNLSLMLKKRKDFLKCEYGYSKFFIVLVDKSANSEGLLFYDKDGVLIGERFYIEIQDARKFTLFQKTIKEAMLKEVDKLILFSLDLKQYKIPTNKIYMPNPKYFFEQENERKQVITTLMSSEIVKSNNQSLFLIKKLLSAEISE